MGDDMMDELELKMVRYVITLIIYLCRKMKWMITLNLCMITLNKILEINYKYGSLKQPMEKYILWRANNNFYFSKND